MLLSQLLHLPVYHKPLSVNSFFRGWVTATPLGRDALHASQRCHALVELKRDQVKETSCNASLQVRTYASGGFVVEQ
jgi:hypothetical protein